MGVCASASAPRVPHQTIGGFDIAGKAFRVDEGRFRDAPAQFRAKSCKLVGIGGQLRGEFDVSVSILRDQLGEADVGEKAHADAAGVRSAR